LTNVKRGKRYFTVGQTEVESVNLKQIKAGEHAENVTIPKTKIVKSATVINHRTLIFLMELNASDAVHAKS
jgi:hypothetical protein